MILPILAYGDPILRKMGKEISKEFPKLDVLLENMFETMYGAKGVGLAAPQIGLPIRLFIVDATPFDNDEELSEEERELVSTFKHVFITNIISYTAANCRYRFHNTLINQEGWQLIKIPDLIQRKLHGLYIKPLFPGSMKRVSQHLRTRQ